MIKESMKYIERRPVYDEDGYRYMTDDLIFQCEECGHTVCVPILVNMLTDLIEGRRIAMMEHNHER